MRAQLRDRLGSGQPGVHDRRRARPAAEQLAEAGDGLRQRRMRDPGPPMTMNLPPVPNPGRSSRLTKVAPAVRQSDWRMRRESRCMRKPGE